MRRETQNLLLILVGGTILEITLDDTYLRYVKSSLQPYLLISGSVIVLLGLAAIVRDIRAGRASADPHSGSSRPYWMLLVPAAVLLFLTPPALSTGAVPSTGPELVSATSPPRPLPPVAAGAPKLSLREVVHRAHAAPETLHGRTISTAGFALPTEDGTGFDLGQLAIACCAADAQLLIVHLHGPLPAGITEGDWLSVTGHIATGRTEPAGASWPTMVIDEARPIDPPKITYGY